MLRNTLAASSPFSGPQTSGAGMTARSICAWCDGSLHLESFALSRRGRRGFRVALCGPCTLWGVKGAGNIEDLIELLGMPQWRLRLRTERRQALGLDEAAQPAGAGG